MQMPVSVQRDSSVPAAPLGVLLMPLFQAVQPAESTLEARDAHEEQTTRRKNRLRDDLRRDDRIAAQWNPGAAALTHTAEREMRPGSYSLARDQARGAAFRQEWRQAAESSSRASRLPKEDVGATEPATTPAPSGQTAPRPHGSTMQTFADTAASQPEAAARSSQEPGPAGGLFTAPRAPGPRAPHSIDTTNHALPPADRAIPAGSSAPPVAPAASQAQSTSFQGAVGSRSASPALRTVVTPLASANPAPAGSVSRLTVRACGPAEETGKNEPLTEQLVRVVRSRLNEKHTVATLRLDPPALGSVRLHMDLREDRLVLRIEPQSELAHRLLTEQTDSLRVALEIAGIRLQRVEIVQPPDGADAARFGQTENFGTDGNRPDDPPRDDAGHSAKRTTEENRDTEVSRPTPEVISIMAPGRGTSLARVNLWA